MAAGRTPTAKRHNVGAYPAELHDPCLTDKGREDAASAATSARLLPRPELLVTSPMRRAVQTMLVAFDDANPAGFKRPSLPATVGAPPPQTPIRKTVRPNASCDRRLWRASLRWRTSCVGR